MLKYFIHWTGDITIEFWTLYWFELTYFLMIPSTLKRKGIIYAKYKIKAIENNIQKLLHYIYDIDIFYLKRYCLLAPLLGI